MQLMHFHTLRSGVQCNASPATERALVAMESILRDRLNETGLFDNVEVEHTDDPDQLVVALCHYRHNVSEDLVAATVERLWDERVSYTFWEAHNTYVEQDFVEFEGATRESVVGRYATVHLVAERAPVPAQRTPERTPEH
jgi:hypothetical protein